MDCFVQISMTNQYCYPYPHPAITTDVVVFSIQAQRLQVLLIRRGQAPFQGMWALPGGFLDSDEDLETCARRELSEETGIRDVYLEQLYTFGEPDRDPRERVVSVVYYALAPFDQLEPVAASDASEVHWFAIDALPPLAFDHERIIHVAHQRLMAKLSYSTIAFQFMPETFTLSELQSVYETVLQERLDKRNFRKKILALGHIEETGEMRRNGRHRPARVFRRKRPEHVEFIR